MRATAFNDSRLTHGGMFRQAVCLLLAVASIALAGCDFWVGTETRIERAREHLDQGNYRAAMNDLKTALQSEPEHVQARILLAELSLRIGDIESADKEIERALAAGATSQQVSAVRYESLLIQQRFDELRRLLEEDQVTDRAQRLVLEARMLSALGQDDEAGERLKSALEQNPDDPQLLLESARLEAKRGSYQPAMDLPARVSQSDEHHASALSLRGAILVSRGAYGDARADFMKAQELGRKRMPVTEKLTLAAQLVEANLALQDADAAESSLGSLTTWAQNSAITHFLRARIAMLRNDASGAVSECQKALQADPQHIPSQILLAAAHLAQNSPEQAANVLDRVLAAHPDNLAARKLLAQVYLSRGEPEKARDLLGAAAAGAQADPQIDWLLGAALLQSGSNSTALEHLERGLAATPDDMQRRVELAGAYIAALAPDKAIEILKSIPPDSAAGARAKGLLVLATAIGKQTAVAQREIANLVAAQPDDATILAAAGAYLVAGGEVERSRQWLERAARLDPKAIGPRMALARLEMMTRNAAGAEARLREVVRIDPRHQVARLGLSELAWSRGDRDQSRKWLEEAISANPSAVDARLRLAQISFIDGNANRARDLLTQAIRVGGDRKAALNGAGKVLARAGLTDEALARFREAAAAGLPEASLNAARLLMELGRSDHARELLHSALAGKPSWREADRLLIELDAREGKVDRAIARATAGLSDASPAARRDIEGDIYSLAGRTTDAITAYEEAQRRQPRGSLALKIFHARRVAGAAPLERSLVQWLERSPEDAQVRRVLAGYYHGSGQLDEAIEHYEALLAQQQVDPGALNNLAWLLHEKGDARALGLARRAHAAAPHVPEIADTLGWILVQSGNISEGLAVLETALAAAPGNAEIQYHAAAAYAKSGQVARATELLQQALRSDSPFASRAAAEGLLQSVSSGGR